MPTNPTRQEIINAHEALEELKNVALSAADFCGDTEKFLMWKNEILKVLPPKPQPTMDDIEWDDDKHYLAEAEHSVFGKVIMLNQILSMGAIEILANDKDGSHIYQVGACNLTPTGKSYTLTEIQE